MARRSAGSVELPVHRLSAAGFRALARGEGGRAVVVELLAAERSRRMLLLRALYDGLSGGGLSGNGVSGNGTSGGGPRPPAGAAAVSYREAWALLERAQRTAPDVFEDILMSPHTGMWLSLALRQLRGASFEDAPLWAVAGHLSALAASAGARAGLDFSLAVPVRRGVAFLPTVGCAELTVAEPWSTAQVVFREGQLRIIGEQGAVVVGPGREDGAPGWRAVRRLSLGAEGPQKCLSLEEFDPYRTFPQPSEPLLLSETDARAWQAMLTDAWELLLRDEPESAEAMRVGLMSVTPTPARERFRPHSVTAGDAFGGVMASRPDDATQLAATLVHEFQHIKLGSLMRLRPLNLTGPGLGPHPGPGLAEELFYAPWRDDPRPLGGLLQGIYAFAGVTRFWCSHRQSADAAQAGLAHFEFALWRTQVSSTVDLVRTHERLTPLGRQVLDALRERCAEWSDESVPAAELRLAQEVAADHRARWRAHHLRPPAAAVEEAVRAWRRRDDRPPPGLAGEPVLVPDAGARFLDTAAVLARHRLSGAGGDGREVERAEGAEDADVLLARGELAGARDAFAALLSRTGAPFGAWAGLGRALAGDEALKDASWLLRSHPERACAVQGALRKATGQGADPVRLAAWLARDRVRDGAWGAE
ncbi:HEXXH motif domain-containing protein [Streptomyces sp. NPDC047525]|uniref:HEXXH motif domain-containing protein n=1 Tax=Streptomyces sp. NPDC047525 TaxID=3155264 RepID=UPI0033E3B7B2